MKKEEYEKKLELLKQEYEESNEPKFIKNDSLKIIPNRLLAFYIKPRDKYASKQQYLFIFCSANIGGFEILNIAKSIPELNTLKDKRFFCLTEFDLFDFKKFLIIQKINDQKYEYNFRDFTRQDYLEIISIIKKEKDSIEKFENSVVKIVKPSTYETHLANGPTYEIERHDFSQQAEELNEYIPTNVGTKQCGLYSLATGEEISWFDIDQLEIVRKINKNDIARKNKIEAYMQKMEITHNLYREESICIHHPEAESDEIIYKLIWVPKNKTFGGEEEEFKV